MATKQNNFKLGPDYTRAIEILRNPRPGEVLTQADVVRYALLHEWERVFPGISFPGDKEQE